MPPSPFSRFADSWLELYINPQKKHSGFAGVSLVLLAR